MEIKIENQEVIEANALIESEEVLDITPRIKSDVIKGEKGDKGDTGTKGDKGDKGDTGEQGVEGKSAYQTWLDAGNTGTELEFLESIKGEKGDTGAGATISIGTVETGESGSFARIVNVGTETNAIFNFNIPKGDKGEQGQQGLKGDKGDTGATGEQGENGATFIPSVDQQGNISWTNDKGLVNPTTVNIKGPQGERGTDGNDGQDGDEGATFIPSVDGNGNISWTNNKDLPNPTTVNIKGEKGDTGEGIVELIGTDDSPINLNNITTVGIYKISGVVTNYPSIYDEDAEVDYKLNEFIMFVSKAQLLDDTPQEGMTMVNNNSQFILTPFEIYKRYIEIGWIKGKSLSKYGRKQGGWSDWKKTDDIEEIIETENGIALKKENGELECRFSLTKNVNCNMGVGGMQRCSTIEFPNFPVEFINIPTVDFSVNAPNGVATAILCARWGDFPASRTNPGRPTVLAGESKTFDATISYIAKGRWK